MGKSLHLRQWQAFFERIYGQRNRQRTPIEIWSRASGRAGRLAKALRQESQEEIIQNLVYLFAWLCGICTRLNTLLDYQVWRKYKNRCPYCQKDEKCLCITSLGTKIAKVEYVFPPNVPCTLIDWQKMFWRIYGDINKVQTISQIGLHLLEEVLEVSRVLLSLYVDEIGDELADVFAWMCGLANRCNINLEDITWQIYQNGCPFCQKQHCECL